MRVRSLPGHQVGALSPGAAASRSASAALRGFVRAQAGAGEAAAAGLLADPAQPLALGFSGGADSTALLLAARRVWPGRRLIALHVHHGLQAAADDFAAHVVAQCKLWDLECRVLRVQVELRRGRSLEEQAREQRHAALQRAARDAGCAWLLLGHQADDQAESLLLALLRGAGPAGLAAMPAAVCRGGVWLGRPLLGCAAAGLRAELDAAGVAYVRDPMNADAALRRSRIRHELLPVIDSLEPAWRRTLARSAALCAQAARQLRSRAALDLDACRGRPGLRLDRLAALGGARRAEALRAWLGELGLRCSRAQMDNLCRQLDAAPHAAVRVRIAGAQLWRDGEWLRCEPAAQAPQPVARKRRSL